MNNTQGKVTNEFRITREELHLSREKVSELSVFLSARQIEKIENDQTIPRPDTVLCLASIYNAPHLINHYCSHICDIGKLIMPEIKECDLHEIINNVLRCSAYLELKRDELIHLVSSEPVNRFFETNVGISENELLKVLSLLSSQAIALSMIIYKKRQT